jgi:surface carbohydrate biosynthesis protein (TIGR04326 family)
LPDQQSCESLLLWDCSAEAPADTGLTYRWNGYVETGAVFSLLRYVEAHGERLRGKYLEWIHAMGEGVIDGRRLADHMVLKNGLSYWWMTLFAEKNPWKSPAIVDAIRLFALEDIVQEKRPARLRLVSPNRALDQVISTLCRELNIEYEWQCAQQPARMTGLRGLVRSLPQPLRAAAALVNYLREQRSLGRVKRPAGLGGGKTLFFGSYFIHLDPKSCAAGEFHSHQWGRLPALLQANGYATNWLHHFLPSDAVPDTKHAIGLAGCFNQCAGRQEWHTFVGAHLSWRLVLRVLRRWTGLQCMSWRLTPALQKLFRPSGSHLALWPIMKNDWNASMRGSTSAMNLLWIELFDAALGQLPRQPEGLFLSENQSWERALIHAWRKHGHGRLIAVPHSTVRFWDLRYYNDVRTVRSTAPAAMPQADLAALNGRAVVNAYRSVDFPVDRIVECESLRYEYLSSVASAQRDKIKSDGPLKVLILGDYLSTSTVRMLELLAMAASHLTIPVTYTVKPHPSFTVKAADFPALELNIDMQHLSELLPRFDVAYSSNITSAAVDAYLGGLPVVVALEDTELNFSPLRGEPGARFVSTPQELALALLAAAEDVARPADRTGFFFLDPQLHRWKRLLGISSA